MLKTVMLAAALVATAVPRAEALSEWWTPKGKTCPAFDSEEACEQWCSTHQAPCGGSSQCGFEVGPERPECPPPAN